MTISILSKNLITKSSIKTYYICIKLIELSITILFSMLKASIIIELEPNVATLCSITYGHRLVIGFVLNYQLLYPSCMKLLNEASLTIPSLVGYGQIVLAKNKLIKIH